MMRTNLYGWLAIGLTAGTIVVSVAVYPSLPEKIPTHWNIQGEVDGYGTKPFGLFLLPGMMVGFLVMFKLLPLLSPKDFEIEPFKTTFQFIMLTALGMFAYIHFVAMLFTWRHVAGREPFDMTRVPFGGMLLFFTLIGNVLGKVRKNFYVGVRVPWTLASDRVWNDTHRFAAWTMVGGSLIGFLMIITGVPVIWSFAVLMVGVLSPVAYSFVLYKKLERKGAL